MNAPLISVVIVNWNGGDYLPRCLSSLFEQGVDMEVILVDNASSDGSQIEAKRNFPQIKLLQMQRNLGYAKGCNEGVKEAKGKYILLLNPDVILLPHSLSRLLSFAESHPQVGAVAPKFLNPDGSLQPFVRGFPYPLSLILYALFLSHLFPSSPIFARYRMTYLSYDETQEVEQPMSSCLLVRRSAWDDVGGMDEAFPLYFNDVDFLYRLRKKGWKIYLFPQARIVHFYGGSTSLLPNLKRLLISYRGLLSFYRKHFPLWLPLAYLSLLGFLLHSLGGRRERFLVFQPLPSCEGGPLLSVVIVNWNGGEYLMNCLSSLFEQDVDMEVILVDNASTDRSQIEAKRRFPKIKLLQMEENLGYAKGCNEGIKASRGKYILILNPDVVLLPGALSNLLSFAEKHPEAGIIGPQLLDFDGKLQMSCRSFPSYETGIFRGTFLEKLLPRSRSLSRYLLSNWDHSTPRYVDWVSGAAMLLRREFLQEAGIFDETFYMYCEDVDMGMRAKEFGWKVLYCPYARIMHRIGGSSDKRVVPMLVKFHLSHYLFFQKHWGWRTSLFSRVLLISGFALRTFLLILKNRMDIMITCLRNLLRKGG